MHELSIALAMVEMASEHARRAGADRVTRLNCRFGLLRQVDPESMQAAFDIAREGTPCATAELRVETVPMLAQCPACGRTIALGDWNWTCKTCGVDAVPLSGGDEMELTSIEAENTP